MSDFPSYNDVQLAFCQASLNEYCIVLYRQLEMRGKPGLAVPPPSELSENNQSMHVLIDACYVRSILVNSGVPEPKLCKFLYNVDGSSPPLRAHWRCDILISFGLPVNKVGVGQFCQSRPKIGCHSNSLLAIEKRRSDRSSAVIFLPILKIW